MLTASYQRRPFGSHSVPSRPPPGVHITRPYTDSGQSIQPPVFVDEYDKTCALCSQILLDPYMTRCGHRLCKQCLTTHIQQNGDSAMCPFNEDDCETLSITKNDGSVVPDFYLLKKLKKMMVYCDFKHRGCPKTFPWGDPEHHTSTCKYGRENCPHASLGCDVRCVLADLDCHVSECQYAPNSCELCSMPNIASCYMEEHLQSCPKVGLECAHQCGAVMLRNEIEAHLQDCPNKPVPCKFKRMGCTFQGSVGQVKEHEKEDPACHLDIMTSHCEHLEEQIANIKHTQRESTRSSEASAKAIEDTLKQHAQKIERQEELFKQSQKTVAKCLEMVDQSKRQVPQGAESADVKTLKTQVRATQTTVSNLQERFRSQSLKHSEFDLRFQTLETASYNGVLLWKIRNYYNKKADAKRVGGVQSLYSQAFYTSRYGYRMCARVYLNGDGKACNNHLSLFFVVMQGEFDPLLKWPFRQKVTLMIMDQTGQNHHIQDTFIPELTSVSFQRPQGEMNVASGCPMFIRHDVLEASNSLYLQNNVIFLKLVVDVNDLPQ